MVVLLSFSIIVFNISRQDLNECNIKTVFQSFLAFQRDVMRKQSKEESFLIIQKLSRMQFNKNPLSPNVSS